MTTNKILLDLTHSITPDIPTWDGSCGFEASTTLDYEQCDGVTKFRIQEFNLKAGIGTHIDAPAHCAKNGKTIEQLELKQLIAPGYIINVSSKADANYFISEQDIYDFEEQWGKIKPESIVIGYTGWSRSWRHPSMYRNQDSSGTMRFPGFSAQAAQLLLERNIAALGIDTLSLDGGNLEFPVHRLMLGADKYLIENIADCSSVPPTGAIIIALPINIKGATEAATRLVALIER